MTQAEITQAVKEILAKNPDLLLREYLSQQVAYHMNEIRWHDEKIQLLKKEIRELAKS